jgi:hypothetical protein
VGPPDISDGLDVVDLHCLQHLHHLNAKDSNLLTESKTIRDVWK